MHSQTTTHHITQMQSTRNTTRDTDTRADGGHATDIPPAISRSTPFHTAHRSDRRLATPISHAQKLIISQGAVSHVGESRTVYCPIVGAATYCTTAAPHEGRQRKLGIAVLSLSLARSLACSLSFSSHLRGQKKIRFGSSLTPPAPHRPAAACSPAWRPARAARRSDRSSRGTCRRPR